MKTTIFKTLEYPMDSTTMTKEEWDYVISPILSVCKPRAGIARSFPHDVLFAPLEHQGGGLTHPWYKQELHHMYIFKREICAGSMAGRQLQSNLEAYRLEMGAFGELTETDSVDTAGSTTDHWLKTMINSAQHFGIDIEDHFEKLHPSREHDVSLRSAFLELGYRGKQLQRLNNCRLFLHAVSLADICTG